MEREFLHNCTNCSGCLQVARLGDYITFDYMHSQARDKHYHERSVHFQLLNSAPQNKGNEILLKHHLITGLCTQSVPRTSTAYLDKAVGVGEEDCDTGRQMAEHLEYTSYKEPVKSLSHYTTISLGLGCT